MKYKIVFLSGRSKDAQVGDTKVKLAQLPAPRRSVVQVRFRERNLTLAYYNDRFDLHPGDLVYVEGKLAGYQGRVVEVNYNFRIKLSDYKRVIALVDTHVKGQFFAVESYFVTFDRMALPPDKAVRWFKVPEEEEEYVCGRDESSFSLEHLGEMKVSQAIAERGHDYYMEDRVRYLCLDGTRGYAIVEGSSPYEVEFDYAEGQISGLTCSCYCSGICKHEVAVMLQLRALLDQIGKDCGEQYVPGGYFAAVLKETLFTYGVGSRNGACLTFE